MQYRLIIIISLLFSTSSAYSQAPGFMGKNFSIGLEVPMVVSFGVLSYDDYSYQTKNENGDLVGNGNSYNSISYRYKPTLYFEYTMNRKTSVQLFGRFYKRKEDVDKYYDTITGDYYYPSDRANTQTLAFGLKFKFFKGDNINPVGKYFFVGIENVTKKFLVDDITFYSRSSDVSRPPTNLTSNSFVPTIGFATQRPMSSFLLFNLGVEFGLPLAIFGDAKGSSPTIDTWADMNASNSLKKDYIFNITIGFSLLP